MVKKYNSLEEYVMRLLRRIEIEGPEQLNIENISIKLGIKVLYTPFPSMRVGKVISIDSRSSKKQQWQSFSHELCHVLWHYGSQLNMPMSWEVYQEIKANNFSLHFCIPSFMLDQLTLPNYEKNAIWFIEETFNVEREFAEETSKTVHKKFNF